MPPLGLPWQEVRDGVQVKLLPKGPKAGSLNVSRLRVDMLSMDGSVETLIFCAS